jgi:hypothetical protein
MHAQAKKDMQHHMNILQHRLAKMQGADQRAEKAERAQRDMAREIKRLRAALESLTKDPPPNLDEPDEDWEVVVKMRAIAQAALDIQ